MLTPFGTRGPDMVRSSNSVVKQPLQDFAIFSNSAFAQARAAPMPRLGSVVDVSMYIVGKEDRLFGQSKIAVGKITLK